MQKSYPEWVVTDSEKKMHDSFVLFVWMLWRHLRLPEPTKRQRAICRWLEKGPRRRMVQAFRGVGKSWLTAAYVLWRLYRNAEERVLIVSANESKATEIATFIHRLLNEVEQLAALRTRQGQRDSVLAFDVGPSGPHQAPSVRVVGIKGQLTGGRATIIVSDDVEVPKNSFTETMREQLSELVKEYDAVIVPGGEIIYLGTPQTEQSIYNLLPERGYSIRLWPARYPNAEERKVYGDRLAPDILRDLEAMPTLVGRSTDPERFTDLDLAEREASYGRSGFALQFQLNTSLSDAERYPLKISDLIVMDIDGEQAPIKLEWTSDPRNAWADIPNVGLNGDRAYRPLYISPDRAKYQGCVMVIDPSGRGADETAWVVMKALNGMLYVPAWGGFRSGYDNATLTALVGIARDHAVKHVLIESNFGDGMFQKLIEPHFASIYPVTLEEYRATGQKELRIIEDLEPVMNQHRLVVSASMLRKDAEEEDIRYSLAYQLTHISHDRGALARDDRVDVLARACRYFQSQLAQDTKKAEEAYRAKLREQQYAEYIKAVMGSRYHRKKRPNYVNGPSVLRAPRRRS